MKPKNSTAPKKKSKSKKNPLPPTIERKPGNAQQQTNATSINVEQEKPAPVPAPKSQPPPTVIVEPPPPLPPSTTVSPTPDTISSVDTKSIDFSIKHPLNSKWTLWYYYPEKNVDWDKCQHKIHTVDTVEDFWSLADHIRPPSDLNSGVDYSFFKNGIRPMWEDLQNVKGGRLTVISAAKSRGAFIDEVWLDVLLFLIGENHENADSVCGVVLNSRNYGVKIAVWTSTQDRSITSEIGQSIKSNCSSFVQQIPFEAHTDTQKKSQGYSKSSSRGPIN